MDRIKKTHTHTNVYANSPHREQFVHTVFGHEGNLILLAFCQGVLSKTNTNVPTVSFKCTCCGSEAKIEHSACDIILFKSNAPTHLVSSLAGSLYLMIVSLRACRTHS